MGMYSRSLFFRSMLVYLQRPLKTLLNHVVFDILFGHLVGIVNFPRANCAGFLFINGIGLLDHIPLMGMARSFTSEVKDLAEKITTRSFTSIIEVNDLTDEVNELVYGEILYLGCTRGMTH